MADLSPYLDEEDELPSLRKNSFHTGKDDGDQAQDMSKSKEAHGQHKEVAFLMAALETSQTSQPASFRNWPAFVTLVS